ncbi:outer membrane lipoprotein-sorting protein [Ekhidna sp.]|uniref:outer membrane lipoprotein-sorting protein n=1 Tax=Ekhidna sp. TaxID=2608089 RepID=UPI00351701D7
MRKIQLIVALTSFFAFTSISGQDVSVDEIINGYFENTGGIENWKAVKGMKMTAKVNQGGMEIPIEIVQMTNGRQYTKISLQGNDFYQGVFDGETMWSTNFQSLKAEKADAETTSNAKLDANDFPDSWLDYKDKGYTAEFIGKETIDGAETFKVKLIKEPKTVDGKQVEDVYYYYFDVDSYVPLAMDSEVKAGPQAGMVGRVTFSDYQEVDGLYFPFSMTQGVKDGPSQPITLTEITLNPEVDESVFAFPSGGE